jgi:hypothetical protein
MKMMMITHGNTLINIGLHDPYITKIKKSKIIFDTNEKPFISYS